MTSCQWRVLVAALVLLVGSLNSFAADDPLGQGVRFRGFATLGLTNSGDDNLGLLRELDREAIYSGDWSFKADSLLGVQLDWQASDNLSAAIQLVGKDRVDDSLENSVEWAFLRYRINPSWTVRAGRMGMDLFMLSEYRNLGFAYLWARPPPEFYTMISFSNFDGVDIAWTRPLGEGMLTAKIQTGMSEFSTELAGVSLDLKLNPMVAGSLNWETEDWRVRFGASWNEVKSDQGYFPGSSQMAAGLEMASVIWPQALYIADQMRMDDPVITYYTLGASYNKAPWQIQSEISYVDSETGVLQPITSAYISAGYRIGNFIPYLMVANSHNEHQDLPDPPVIPGAPQISSQLLMLKDYSQSLFDAMSSDQTTLTAGLRWDFRYNMALKVQADHTWVSEDNRGSWAIRSLKVDESEINTFSIILDGIF